MKSKFIQILFFSYLLSTIPYTLAYSDTVNTNEGKEIKGIVVEDYKDRIVLSTINGEQTIMKSDIRELYYDNEEQNLVKLAEQAKEKRDYVHALTYYDLAYRTNPNSKAAKDGLVFLEGYLFRKEQAQKEEDVKRREDLERQGASVPVIRPENEEISQKAGRLSKVLGMRLDVKNGMPEVVSIQRHSPADEAGIRTGDRITAIWARLTGYMSLNEVLDALLDKPSLELKISVERTVDVEVSPFRLIAFGSSGLIGASFTMEFDGLTVSGVKENGAAAAAGIKKGDLVLAIDGKSIRYTPLNKAIDAIRWTKEHAVKLTIKREVLIWRRD